MGVEGDRSHGVPHVVPPSTGGTRGRLRRDDLAERGGMDVRALLQEACERAQVSQAELARRAGSDPSLLSAWARGRVSPSVSSLARVLAAVDLQVRPSLEPLLADLDSRVDEVLAGTVTVDLEGLSSLAAHAGVEQSWGVELPDGSIGRDQGSITWAFDGATALALHGLAFPQDVPAVCLLLDDASRSWLTKGFVIAPGQGRISFWDASFEQARDHLRGLSAGRYGMHLVRLVEQMPPSVRLQPEGTASVFPVLAVDAAAVAHPALAEVLDRLRVRSGAARRTG